MELEEGTGGRSPGAARRFISDESRMRQPVHRSNGRRDKEGNRMMGNPPRLIAIEHDDFHARHVGRTADGRQFFLTTPFSPPLRDAGNEFVALFLFDDAGNLLEARIDEFGSRETLDEGKRGEVFERRLRELGEVSFGRIQIAPFAVERFGTQFGLIAVPPEGEENNWWVELHPGNYMAFYEPWDSGIYDT